MVWNIIKIVRPSIGWAIEDELDLSATKIHFHDRSVEYHYKIAKVIRVSLYVKPG